MSSNIEYLHNCLSTAVRQHADKAAVVEGNGTTVTYAELNHLAQGVRDSLFDAGVKEGDRVGIYMRKSIESVAAIFGILQAGAAYVPVDAKAPIDRNLYIFSNCGVAAIIVEQEFADDVAAGLAEEGKPHLLIASSTGNGDGLAHLAVNIDAARHDRTPPPSSLAYILYTSGSTGKPKGVQITHENAASFVQWCIELLAPNTSDVFSSHAPFHFDLSILDIYTCIRSGGTLRLIDDQVGKSPGDLAQFIADAGITIWYSAPSILGMLVQYGKLETLDHGSLRFVLFAGEVFPVTRLRELKALWRGPRYLNLYGPTETNVCTYFEVPPSVPEDRTTPYPIGKVCSHLRGKVVDPEGRETNPGEEGELCIIGPSVTPGYWNLPEQTAKAYFVDDAGGAWYRTGDLVFEDDNGDFVFVGRRDRMVKKRGFRVELGEIEACLYQHEDIAEVAVIADAHPLEGVKIVAHVAGKAGLKLSPIKLKKFCVAKLPGYMVPDAIRNHSALPKTSTDKIDYQSLINQSKE